jgi:LPXTG-site transpeptidase (sortase) family protein
VRRAVGLALVVGGGLLLSFAMSRYAMGWYRAEQARQAWYAAEARSAVALAHASTESADREERITKGAPVARLVIPRIGLDEVVLEGVGADELNAAPGHVPGSAFPGEGGNSIISAHRDRHFDHLGAVQLGDTIETEFGRRKNSWIVIGRRVVSGTAPALFATTAPTLTLTTCWPIRFLGPAPDRLVVTARLLVRAIVAGEQSTRRLLGGPTKA